MDVSRIGSIGASRETRAAWLSDYHEVLEEANEQVVRLLTAEWLVNTDDYGASSGAYAEKRRKEMIRVRRLFIPELVIRLHSLLFASRKWFPGNLKRALNLANIVADSRYRLYDDFLGMDVDEDIGPLQKQLEEQQAQVMGRKRVRKTRLGDYLSAVRQAVLGGLDGGGSDPFAMVAIKVTGSVRA
ncbi:hypothetical protein AX14_011064 [Amanita brunnescens Koide BX004]|nr:hypothetical protein AX14_011064 [Amanita brunnescens Koide BX004]